MKEHFKKEYEFEKYHLEKNEIAFRIALAVGIVISVVAIALVIIY